ncbi:ArgE/DapE family deacylase [Bifidobacterium xylocopae]|uniref:Probable succinyl-diaminopimelate desuccinylase n=1 Tax=Bifidobacterium xylocopae TaxID=2493119 RepID=A0A366KAT7_9BIFI|nr:ArgE/DapE family deacylase [Bifidobacterium xylocopae]RBP98846.1 succinyl-diaminopimelate desuccinylase [Bifidobacterium xylocopae]
MTNDEKMELLRKLVAFQSINGHELPVARFIKSLFDQEGIESQIVPTGNDRADLVASLGSGHPVLAISGHMDVVDVNTANWKTDPFTLTEAEDGDTLYGRGSTDMKSGLAAMIISMIELKREGTPLKGTLKFLVTSGEEVGQEGAEILQRKGYMKDVDALLIGEPSGYLAVYANKGELDLTVHVKGHAAHSSTPALGVNAVEALLEVLDRITTRMASQSASATNQVLGDTVFNIDTIHGGNQVNAIPADAEAEINIRTIPEFGNQEILKAIQGVIDDFNSSSKAQASLSVDMDIVPIIGNVDSELVRLAQEVAKPYMAKVRWTEEGERKTQAMYQAIGIPFSKTDLVTVGVSGGTDGSKFLVDRPIGFDYLMFGPGSGTQHQDNEWVSKAMYLDFTELYKELFKRYLA